MVRSHVGVGESIVVIRSVGVELSGGKRKDDGQRILVNRGEWASKRKAVQLKELRAPGGIDVTESNPFRDHIRFARFFDGLLLGTNVARYN